MSIGLGFPELIILLVIGMLLVLSLRSRRRETISGRLARLERKVDRILDHLGIGGPDPPPEGVADLLAQGRKIEAIKVYREKTGVGLAEAKAAVEAYEPGRAKPANPLPDELDG